MWGSRSFAKLNAMLPLLYIVQIINPSPLQVMCITTIFAIIFSKLVKLISYEMI